MLNFQNLGLESTRTDWMNRAAFRLFQCEAFIRKLVYKVVRGKRTTKLARNDTENYSRKKEIENSNQSRQTEKLGNQLFRKGEGFKKRLEKKSAKEREGEGEGEGKGKGEGENETTTATKE